MFQFRIGGVDANSFYLSSRGEEARYVFELLMEHTEDGEVNEKSKGIYIVDRDAARAAMMRSMAKGDVPAERVSHRAEASWDEVRRVANMWFDVNGIIYMAEEAMEDGKDLILEVWDTKE